jgi:hypothetical protein
MTLRSGQPAQQRSVFDDYLNRAQLLWLSQLSLRAVRPCGVAPSGTVPTSASAVALWAVAVLEPAEHAR